MVLAVALALFAGLLVVVFVVSKRGGTFPDVHAGPPPEPPPGTPYDPPPPPVLDPDPDDPSTGVG